MHMDKEAEKARRTALKALKKDQVIDMLIEAEKSHGPTPLIPLVDFTAVKIKDKYLDKLALQPAIMVRDGHPNEFTVAAMHGQKRLVLRECCKSEKGCAAHPAQYFEPIPE